MYPTRKASSVKMALQMNRSSFDSRRLFDIWSAKPDMKQLSYQKYYLLCTFTSMSVYSIMPVCYSIMYVCHSIVLVCHSIMPVCHSFMSVSCHSIITFCNAVMAVCHLITTSRHPIMPFCTSFNYGSYPFNYSISIDRLRLYPSPQKHR